MTLPSLLTLLAGLVLLVAGAQLLLRSGTRLAGMLGVSPILIGLLVVSAGTSIPELAVGVTAAREGSGALSVGNVAGANLINLLLILGLSAWLRPLPTDSMSVRLDVPVMAAASTGLFLLGMDGSLERGEGLLLLLAGGAYVIALVRTSRLEDLSTRREFAGSFGTAAAPGDARSGTRLVHALLLLAGIAMTLTGANALVGSAVALAAAMGVTQDFIGLTIVAIGTTMPELVTTLVATARNQRDVAIGNLVGSCIFNVLWILGVTLSLSADPVTVGMSLRWIDLPLAAGVALLCIPVFHTRRTVSRLEGALLVLGYLVYLALLLRR